MTNTTNRITAMTNGLAERGFDLFSVQLRTPDGRAWAVDTSSTGGFRLFEIDLDDREGPTEHDAIDGDTWTGGDLIDYLRAVGEAAD